MRKWTYLVATLLMAGTTATFTGCIDTDEPEGIAELRGAKSEFIKAQAAVELVEVELKKAKVAEQELINAGKEIANKSAEINLKLDELAVKLKELEVERDQATTEEAKAKAEVAIAKADAEKAQWEGEKALIVEQYKEKMLLAETATAKAQDAYKQAMEQIEASKVLLTDEEQLRLNVVEAKVANAKIAMDMAMYGYATTKVTTEQRLVSSTTTTDDQSSTTSSSKKYITYYVIESVQAPATGPVAGSLKKLQQQLADYPNWVADGNIEAKLQLAVKQAESTLEAAQKTADKWKAILDNEYTTLADWEAQVKTLDEEMAALVVEKRKQELQKGILETDNPVLITNKTAADKALDDAKKALGKIKDNAKTASDYSKKADKSIIAGLKTAVNDKFSGTVRGYNVSTGEFSYTAGSKIVDAQALINNWNKLIDAATQGINLEDIAWSQGEVAKAEADAKNASAIYEADYKEWEKARDNAAKVETIDVTASKKAAEDAITAYNKLNAGDRTKDENISKLATALSDYYGDLLAKNLQSTSTKVANPVNASESKAISTWIIANPADNYKKIVGVQLGLITWTTGSITEAKAIDATNKANLIDNLGSPTGKTADQLWYEASGQVFGHEFDLTNDKPRKTLVTSDMILKKVNEDKLSVELQGTKYGTLGNSIYATANAARLKGLVEQASTYAALKVEFTAQYAKEQAAFDKKKAELTENQAKAETDRATAQAAYDKVFKEVEDALEKVNEDWTYKDAIKGKVQTAITNYITDQQFGVTGSSLEQIKEAANTEYLKTEAALLTNKSYLAVAKRNLKKFAEGTYTDGQFIEDTFAHIQEQIKVRQAEYDAAEADYNAASTQLKALLAIFLK